PGARDRRPGRRPEGAGGAGVRGLRRGLPGPGDGPGCHGGRVGRAVVGVGRPARPGRVRPVHARHRRPRRGGARPPPRGRGGPGAWASLGLPVALSLDNLVVGFGLGAVRVPTAVSALTLGAASGAMAMAGLYLGSLIGRAVPARAERLGGAALTLLAVVMAFG